MSQLDRSLLAGFLLFRDMSPTDLDQLLEHARSMRVVKNATIFEQAEQAHSFFLLLDGYVRVVRTTPDGQQVIVRYIVPGELMGIARALGRSTYPASTIAATDCVVLAWADSLWPKFATAFPAFAARAYHTIGERLQDAQTRVVEMSTEQVQRRVARTLLRLLEQAGRKTDEGILIDLPISRQNIAEMAGTTLHTVSRLLTAWEQDGIVKSGRQQITVIEPHRLLALAGGTTGAS